VIFRQLIGLLKKKFFLIINAVKELNKDTTRSNKLTNLTKTIKIMENIVEINEEPCEEVKLTSKKKSV